MTTLNTNRVHGRTREGVFELDNLATDETTYALRIIDYEHYEIHSGDMFSVHIDNTTAATDDHRTLVGFETPTGPKWMHLVMTGRASVAAEAFLVEGVTIDDDEGTETVVFNRNRNSANTSSIKSLQASPASGSITWMLEAEVADSNFSYTTTLDHVQLIAGGGPKPIGGSARSTEEWILKSGTKYALWIQNLSAAANLHEIQLDWYEHRNK